MFKKFVRSLFHLTWKAAQIMLLGIGYILMTIGKAWMALLAAVVHFGRTYSEELLTIAWLAVYTVLIVKIIKSVRK